MDKQPYLQNGKVYKLQTWYMDGAGTPALTWMMIFKLKAMGG